MFDLSDETIDMPKVIWEAMIDLHKRILTVIPKKRRIHWHEKVEEFYQNYFRNLKPP